jgi:hypothetical protein
MTKELQAAGEAYSPDYYKREKDATLALLNLEKAKEELQQFNDGYRQNEADLRRQKRRKAGAITEDMRAFAEEELDDIASERIVVQDAVDMAKVDSSKMKTLFAEEKRKEENCKGTGQPLHAAIDCILKRHGIDRAAQFGGALAGNGCRRLMADAISIVNEIEVYVFYFLYSKEWLGQPHRYKQCVSNTKICYCVWMDSSVACVPNASI